MKDDVSKASEQLLRNVLTVGSILVVISVAFVLSLHQGRGSHFNPDESRWISRAHYLADLGDPGSPTWDDQYMTRGQPPLGSYAMGLGLIVQGRDLQTNPPWDFSLPWEINVAIGNKPAPADIAAGRAFSAALTAAATLLVIMVASTFLSIPWAIAAGALYALHPFSIYIGSLAMSDALFAVLIAGAAWAAAALGRRPTSARALILGAMLGLGAATKLSPLAVAAGMTCTIMAIVGVSALRRRQLSPIDIRWGKISLLISMAAITTFIAVYPYLWPDPVTRTWRLFAFRTEEMAAQASDWPVMAVPSRAEALRRAHINFSDRYNFAASLAQRVIPAQAPYALRQAEILTAITGFVVLTNIAIRAGPLSAQSLVLMVFGGHVIVTLLGMRSEFDRYHLPMSLLGAIAVAAALDWLLSLWRATPKLESKLITSRLQACTVPAREESEAGSQSGHAHLDAGKSG